MGSRQGPLSSHMERKTLESLSRDQLIAKVLALQGSAPAAGNARRKQSRRQKPFDIAEFGARRIALRFAYKGTRYAGLTSSNPAALAERDHPTVEGQIFSALTRSRLIPEAVDGRAPEIAFSRCVSPSLINFWYQVR